MSHEFLLKAVDLHKTDRDNFQKQVGGGKKQERKPLPALWEPQINGFWQTTYKSYGTTLDTTPSL